MAKTIKEMSGIEYASIIDLSNKGLTKIPDEIFTYKNIQKLILRNNKISYIPKEISSLKRLKMLDLSVNRIELLYAPLFSLTNLETLIINQNRIKSLPRQVGKLKKLKSLSLSGNKLTSLPKEIINLVNLESLNISSNPFSFFPLEILSLNSLERLRIANINFKTFPTQKIINELVSLKSIYCFSSHLPQIRTQDINMDYLFLATYRGNSMERLKSLIELSSNKSEPLEASTKIGSLKGRINGKSTVKGTLRNAADIKDLTQNRNQIFICYSHKDEEWLKKVEVALKSMQFEGLELNIWNDKHLRTSSRWREEIFSVLSRSRIAILLVSNDFLASDFIQNQELPRILERASSNELAVMSIIISFCRFKENKKLEKYQSLNPPDSPMTSMGRDKQDLYLYTLTKDIEAFLNA